MSAGEKLKYLEMFLVVPQLVIYCSCSQYLWCSSYSWYMFLIIKKLFFTINIAVFATPFQGFLSVDSPNKLDFFYKNPNIAESITIST